MLRIIAWFVLFAFTYHIVNVKSISKAFKGEWAFPVVAYEMLVTGENTGQLGLMMEKVANHFQSLHKSLINQVKSLIEPIMIIILAVIWLSLRAE